ncbi:hypothetical protein MN116_000792 [Schistosoma mekongi]|uniref:peptidyl-tRNA hydrolase n=1 Tax=Schistosoma mekongi TaxID=38744 RepID=A0AAE1ZJI4_SCHME|nr:hypothetical protein MN116_000792 [Schistosoma mekongi]
MVFVQYILLRRDISSVLNWPLGAIVAQGCHAATAAITSYLTHPDTVCYLKEISRMHKIVLGVDNEEQLKNIAQKLKDANIDYYLWTEQPENVYTALATRPYEKSMIQSHFKGLKLLS